MRLLQILLLIALFVPSIAFAQQTGKISGQVTDAESGDPLPGVNVVIDETTIGAVSDAEGYYDILNVSPGVYSLRVSFIGYTTQVIENVEVNIDLTTEMNIQMSEATVGLDEVVVTAETPVIQRDISGSQRNISGQEVRQGKYQRINDVLKAQVSVGATGAYNDRPEIRGSNLEQSKFIVDGVDQSDPLSNRPYTNVNLDAVEEVQLLTGGFSAEYGDLRSGVVNVVTKSGGERYSGSANFQYSAPGLKHFGPMPYGHESSVAQPFVNPNIAFTENDFFPGWIAEAENPSRDPQHTGDPGALYALWLWRHRSQDSIDMLQQIAEQGYVVGPNGTQYPVDVNFASGVDPDDEVWHETGDMPDYNMAFTLGGPLPGLNAVKFFATYNRTQQEYYAQFPEPAYKDEDFRLKLTTNIGPSTRLNLHGYYGTQLGTDGGQGPGITTQISSNPYRVFDASNKFWYPNCSVPASHTRQIYGAQLTHTFNANTFLQVDLSHTRVDYEMVNHIRNTAPLPAVEGQTALLQGLIGTDAQIAEYSNPASDQYKQGFENWQDWALVQIADNWYDEGPKGYTPVWWVDVTGEFRMGSCNVRYNDTYTRSYNFASSLVSQVDRNNLIKAGVQFQYDDVFMDYRALDPSVNGGSVQTSATKPMQVGLYITDKLEYQGFIANIGVRLDGFITGEFPVLDASDVTAENGVYSEFLLANNTTTTDENGEIVFDVQNRIPQSRVSHWRLSPRIGISHPIATVGKVFFNYGHMYQMADMYQLYRIQYNITQGYRVSDLGNPNLAPPRTIQYELGYEQNLFDSALLRMTGYYKNVNAEVNTAEFVPLGQSGYDRYQNNEFSDVRGFEVFAELQRDVIPYLTGFVSSNWVIESEGRYGFDRFYQDPTQQSRQVSSQVSEPDVRPILKGSLNFTTPENFGPSAGGFSLLGGLNINVLYTWKQGRRFTWNPAELPLVDNNVRWKPYQRWDARLSKSLFQRGNVNAIFYIDVTNLFNTKNLVDPQANSEDLTRSANFTWDGMKWYTNTIRDYMFSLGYTAENQNPDGSFDTDMRPGDHEGDDIALPPWSSFRFLEARDIFFGIRLVF